MADDAAAALRILVELSTEAMFSADADGRITSWNHSAERITGRGSDALAGVPFVDLFPEHLQPDMKLALDALAACDPVERFDSEIHRTDGMPVPLSLSIRRLPDHEGRFTGTAIVGREITEQRIAQAALAETEARLQEAEAIAHVGRWLWDVRSGAVQWSEELHRIHGVDPLEFDGTLDGHLRAIHPQDRGRVSNALDVCITERRAFNAEYRIMRPDGTVRRLHAHADAAVDSRGGVIGLRGIARDVTQP